MLIVFQVLNVCYTYASQIKEEARKRGIRGQVLSSLVSYAEGITYIHKNNVSSHVKSGGLHAWAKEKFHTSNFEQKEASATAMIKVVSATTLSYPTVREKGQKNIFCMYGKENQNYIHLFNTALYIVKNERPFSDLSELINLQRTNGIKFEDGKTNNKACVEFISHMADVMRDDIAAILENFAAAEESWKARKTQFEKELLYVKTVIRGKPVELLLKCIHMDDYGSDAADLKRAFDEVAPCSYVV